MKKGISLILASIFLFSCMSCSKDNTDIFNEPKPIEEIIAAEPSMIRLYLYKTGDSFSACSEATIWAIAHSFGDSVAKAPSFVKDAYLALCKIQSELEYASEACGNDSNYEEIKNHLTDMIGSIASFRSEVSEDDINIITYESVLQSIEELTSYILETREKVYSLLNEVEESQNTSENDTTANSYSNKDD